MAEGSNQRNINVAHGTANAILLPLIVEYNALADSGKYYKIYNYIAKKPVRKEDFEPFEPLMLVEAIRELNDSLGIPATLGAVGVTEDKIDAMADDAIYGTTYNTVYIFFQKTMQYTQNNARLIASKLSSLKSCSILHASAIAVSRLTPMRTSRSVSIV